MALAALFIGGLVGFGSFIVALTYFQTGFWEALAIYSGSGMAMIFAILLISTFPPSERRASERQERPRARSFGYRTRES